MDVTTRQKLVVLGAGNFGTCLAQHLAELGHEVHVWSNQPEVVTGINSKHQNPLYLSNAILSKRVIATNKISSELFSNAIATVLAVPTQALREVLAQVKDLMPKDMLLICAAKGVEVDTLKLPLGIFEEVLGSERAPYFTVLSGPSFAAEVMAKQPTAVVVAGTDKQSVARSQQLFHNDFFRVYSSDDPVGLEVAGALKNVIAIAAGAVAGLGFENNSRAALVTRGLAEIQRIGIALGANPLTFVGLGGVGDLFLTCSSEKSRNFTVGFRIGRGESVSKVLTSTPSVAEGVYTTKAAYRLARELKVVSPITDQVYEVLYNAKPIQEAMLALIQRGPKAELQGII